MSDPFGDPSYRELPSDTPRELYTITHDYYDHTDADRDLNIVFPIDRLKEMVREGLIGSLAGEQLRLHGTYRRAVTSRRSSKRQLQRSRAS